MDLQPDWSSVIGYCDGCYSVVLLHGSEEAWHCSQCGNEMDYLEQMIVDDDYDLEDDDYDVT